MRIPSVIFMTKNFTKKYLRILMLHIYWGNTFFFFAIFNFNVHVIILFAEILLIDVSWRKGKWKHLKYNDFYNISYPIFNRLLLVDIVKSLLAAGAQPDSRNSKTKRTCLHEVVSNRSKTLLDKSRFTIIQMLTWSCIK